jgi:hypothetical protein
MPKQAHEALERQATKKGLTGEGRRRYIFGALGKMKKKKNRKGVTMDHAAAALGKAMKGGY